jgi:hypothetical protein
MVGNLRDVLELDRCGVQVVSVRETWRDTGSAVRPLSRKALELGTDALLVRVFVLSIKKFSEGSRVRGEGL